MHSIPLTSWVDVDLSAIAANIAFLSDKVPDKKTLLMVKANAYGHGLIPVSRLAEKAGVSYLGITEMEDLYRLRESNITLPVLLFAEPDLSFIQELSDQNTHIVISSVDYLRRFVASEGTAQLNFHIKFNAGLNRFGIDSSEISAVIEILRNSGRQPSGLATHFSSAADNQETTEKELASFMHALGQFQDSGFTFSVIHARNSAATAWMDEPVTNTVRLGLAAYGLQPSLARALPLRPAMTWTAKIIAVRTVASGERVGYGGTHTVNGNLRLGVLGVGYSDGIRRSPQHQQYVLYGKKQVPIVADVMMNHTFLDFSECPEVRVGDEVTLLGPDLSAETVAQAIGTVNEEVVTTISRGITRLYTE